MFYQTDSYTWTLSTSQAFCSDHGFPALNTVGRYFGVGWSHHTYHSQVDGRFDVVSNRHPSCAYPSSSLSQIYSPGYINQPPRPLINPPTPTFWHAPSVVDQPTLAKPKMSILETESKPLKEQPKKTVEELAPPEALTPPIPKDPPKPKEPPPSWLKPYLEEDNVRKGEGEVIELDPSPSDLKSSLAPEGNRYRL